MTEKELEQVAMEEQKVSMEEWGKLRERLIGLTDVTKSHFDKLVLVGLDFRFCTPRRSFPSVASSYVIQELEKGMEKMLDDYNEHQHSPPPMEEQALLQAPETSKPKDKKKAAKPARTTKRTRAAQKNAGTGSIWQYSIAR